MNQSQQTCNICGCTSPFVFTKKIFLKYDVLFYKCKNCEFIQTERPYWLAETYQSAAFALDTGLIARPIALSGIVDRLIMKHFNGTGKFLDYGGGNGVFVRLMRDKGFNFYRYDKYAKNIYALCFDLSDLSREEQEFDLITSFEVLEHFEKPLEELSEMFARSKNILCSTFLNRLSNAADLSGWWYIGELHGQHISFYSKKSLEIVAERFGCYYYSNNIDLHLFTPKKLRNVVFHRSPIADKISSFFSSISGGNTSHPPSLTLKDAEWTKNQFINGKLRR